MNKTTSILRHRWIPAITLGLSLSGCISISIDQELSAATRRLQQDPIELRGPNQTRAQIDTQGDLRLDEQPVPTNDSQRLALLNYRSEVLAFAVQVMEESGKLARNSVNSLIFNALIGREKQASKDVEDKALALLDDPRLCAQWQRVLSTKQAVDLQLPQLAGFNGPEDRGAGPCRPQQ